jgi:hypothetical protein
MKRLNWFAALAIVVGAGTSAVAESDFTPSPSVKPSVPRLVEIMGTAQLQHLKLWLAGDAQNWDLAAYELRQLTDSLTQAAVLYPGIPVTNVTTMREPLLGISDAIAARNSRRFSASMRKLTDDCNACHTSMDRGYIVMAAPAEHRPLSNQIFILPGRDRTR